LARSPCKPRSRSSPRNRQYAPAGVADRHKYPESKLGVMRTYYGKSCAVPPALKSGNSCVRASHWLLTQAVLSPSRGCSLCSGGGADRCSRGGPSEGRLSLPAASPLRRRGRAWLEHRGLSASRGCCTAGGRDGAGRLAVGGVAVQIGGGSVIFGSVTVGLGRLCRGGTCPVGRLWHPVGARL
jgi:hypothetical protein